MAELDKSVQAHVCVFMFLGINGQSIRPFVSTGEQPGMGPQKMRDLTFFNGAGSLEMLKAVAAQMVHMLILHVHTYYTQQREAGHENKTVPELVGLFTPVLMDPAKTVHDLAQAVDKVFRFKNEGTAAVPVAAMVAEQPVSAPLRRRLQKLGIS